MCDYLFLLLRRLIIRLPSLSKSGRLMYACLASYSCSGVSSISMFLLIGSYTGGAYAEINLSTGS